MIFAVCLSILVSASYDELGMTRTLEAERVFLDNIPIYRAVSAKTDIEREVNRLKGLGFDESEFLEDMSDRDFKVTWNYKKAFNMLNIERSYTRFLGLVIFLLIFFLPFITLLTKLEDDEECHELKQL
jgi:hypothetical protein